MVQIDRREVKGFVEHGVVFTAISGNQASGVCPFCGGQQKFYANMDTAVWDCKRCGRKGNFPQFLQQSWKDRYLKAFMGRVVLDLAADRGLKPKTLRSWGIGWTGSFYAVPAYMNGLICNIQRYTIQETKNKKSRNMYNTTRGTNGIAQQMNPTNSTTVWIAEGVWDGGALSESLEAVGRKEDVFALSGGNVFPKALADLFQDRDVIICLDNDLAGTQGGHRIHQTLTGMARSMKFVNWPDDLDEGYDLRDLLRDNHSDYATTITHIETLLKELPPKLPAQKADEKAAQEADVLDGEGIPHLDVVEEYRKWLYLPNVEPLYILFGTIFANRLGGDPLWLFLVGPPGSCKSELLMSLSDAPLTLATTSITPHTLISGANFPGVGDPSLIPKLNNRVLIVKDFTTILNMNPVGRDEIFGVLRDAYDGKIQKRFGNGVVRNYESKFGIFAGVTPAIESVALLHAVLGERFLKYRLPQAPQASTSKEIIRKALLNLTAEKKMRGDLREIAKRVLSRPVIPEEVPHVSDSVIDRLTDLAQWVAAMRGVVSKERYTGQIMFKPVKEVGTRLAKQLCVLAMGISLFKEEEAVTEPTYKIVAKVARDTAPDRVEEIVRHLYLHARDTYVTVPDVCGWTHFPAQTIRPLLEDLSLLRIVQQQSKGMTSAWKLSPALTKLMKPLGLYSVEEQWLSAAGAKKGPRKLKRVTRGRKV